MASRIEDYALLGDTESAALVGKDGSIDWLTVPRFDSPACFAALLGTEGNGRWQIAPASRVLRVERSYRPGSLVLETVFHTAEGSVALIDCLPPRDGRYDLARLVEGRSGSVPMRLHLTIRFDYGSIVPWVRRCPGGITAVGGPDAMRLATPVELRSENLETTAEFTVAAGQRVPFTLTWYPSDTPAPQPLDAVTAIAESEAWWRAWSSGCTYDGDYADEVLSSLTVLKGLTYAPSGGLARRRVSRASAVRQPNPQDRRWCVGVAAAGARAVSAPVFGVSLSTERRFCGLGANICRRRDRKSGAESWRTRRRRGSRVWAGRPRRRAAMRCPAASAGVVARRAEAVRHRELGFGYRAGRSPSRWRSR